MRSRVQLKRHGSFCRSRSSDWCGVGRNLPSHHQAVDPEPLLCRSCHVRCVLVGTGTAHSRQGAGGNRVDRILRNARLPQIWIQVSRSQITAAEETGPDQQLLVSGRVRRLAKRSIPSAFYFV